MMPHSEIIREAILEKYGALLDQLWIGSHDDYGLVLDAIIINPQYRNLGTGTHVMNDLVDYADANNLIITLTPSPDYGGSKARLTKYYKRFGFKPNKGRNKDFRFRETMIRQPGVSR